MSMNILITGDFCPQYRTAKLIEEGCFRAVFGDIVAAIGTADYSIANFECAVTNGGEKPIEKLGPNLCCSERGIEAVKWAGFDCVTLANNHFYDFGEEGVKNTLAACEKYGIDVIGGGKDLYDASKVLYKEINGEVLAVINCCEHEFSIATEKSGGSNPLNPIQQYYAIQEARRHADFVLVIVHGGHEHYQLPSPRMQETYRFFVDAGADAVINHHQHCYSGYEIYQGTPIFYGLGNFCFDKPKYRNSDWNEGYMVLVKMGKTISFDVIPYKQCSEEPKVTLLLPSAFDERVKELNNIIEDPQKLAVATKCYYHCRSKEYSNIIEPMQNRFYKALKRRGWIPSFISAQRKIRSANYISCESHRDILSCYLEQQ